jgi:chromate reductase
MSGVRVLAIAGSLRKGSFNRKLLAIAVKLLTEQKAEVEVADLQALAMPVYDGDIEEGGFPDSVNKFRAQIAAAQALCIATPEYNHSVPGGLKNAIDWASRPPDQPLKGRAAILMGASTGHFGTVRCQLALRPTLGALGVFVLPTGVTVPYAEEAFDESGQLKDPKLLRQVSRLTEQLISFVKSYPQGL